MTTENNGAAAPQMDSATVADKLYGNTDSGADNKQTDAKSGSQSNSSDSADEANKSSDTEAKAEEKKGEESKQSDVKIYDEVSLPDLPEGMQKDEELFAEVKQVAQKHNVSKEALQDLVNAYSKRMTDSFNGSAEKQGEVIESWAKEIKTDKELGGDNFKQTEVYCQRAIKQFSTPKLVEFLETTGLGNHPELVRTFSKIGKQMSEGGSFEKGNNAGQRSTADILYDKS